MAAEFNPVIRQQTTVGEARPNPRLSRSRIILRNGMPILGMMVIIALVIASPVAWYFMNRWLEDFAYRIHISGWIFLLAGSIAIVIALFTVSFQALKAALANPVISLRRE